MKDHKGDDVVFIQPTCFADKSTSFLFPIPYNETFSYGLGKSFTIEDIINKVSAQGLDAIYSIIGGIYSEDLLAAKIVADYKRVFPEKLPYARSG
jgi:hypothetical protein